MGAKDTSGRKWGRRAFYVLFACCVAAFMIGTICSTVVYEAPPLDNGDQSLYPKPDISGGNRDTLKLTIWNLQQGLATDKAGGASERDISSLRAADTDGNWKAIHTVVDSLRKEKHVMLLQQNISADESSHFGTAMTRCTRQSHPISCLTGGGLQHTGMGAALPEGVAQDSAYSFTLEPIGSWPFKLWKTPPMMEVLRIGHRLVLINIDLPPASDVKSQGILLASIRRRMELELASGNAVIAGGDWGMLPPNFHQEMFSMDGSVPEGLPYMPIDSFPLDWKIMYDPMAPTLRTLEEPFNLHHTGQTTTDFFLCTPNVRVLRVMAMDQQFRYSNHHPVTMEFTFE